MTGTGAAAGGHPADLGVTGLVRAYTQAELTAEEATLACLERIADRDDHLRAFITVSADSAIHAARASDGRRDAGRALGPLDGVPIALKDNIDVAGEACTAGLALYRDRIPATDAHVVTLLKAAGAVLLGKLNMHEGALGTTTDNPTYGRCRNPLDTDYSPGGSSGGSGAAVAAGLCAAALGTDTMGSVRIPAAHCGVCGLKPTAGLVGASGLVPLSWSLDSIGPLARSIGDLALLLQVIAGTDPNDVGSHPLPEDWGTTLVPRQRLQTVRLGVPEAIVHADIDPDVAADFDRALDAAQSLGAEVVDFRIPGWDPSRSRRDGLVIAEVEGFGHYADDLDRTPDGFSDEFRGLLAYGRDVGAPRLAGAYQRQRALAHALSRSVADAGIHALIMPTAPQRAIAHEAPVPVNQADLTALANLTGRPAVSIPVPWAAGSLPSGVQLVGPYFGEAQILTIADSLMRAMAPASDS